jgi:excisionase family DNA binding protein
LHPREIWLTVHEVAELVQVQQETVRRWIRAGELPAVELGGPRSGYRVHREDLDHFLWQRYRTKTQDNTFVLANGGREGIAPRQPAVRLNGALALGDEPARSTASSPPAPAIPAAVDHLARHLDRQGSLSRRTTLPCMTYFIQRDGSRNGIDYISPAIEAFTGHTIREFQADHLLWRRCTHPDDVERVTYERFDGTRGTEPFLLEYRLCSSDGRELRIQEEVAPIDPGGPNMAWDGIAFDITGSRRVEEALTERMRQQEALARFARQALSVPSLDRLFQEATVFVAETLGVEAIKVLELLPGGERLLLRAGVGWQPGLVGQATVGANTESQAGFTLLSNAPVIVADLGRETRFDGPSLLLEHGIVSGVSVIIAGRMKPFGVLGAHTARQRDFSEDDARFMQAVANVLATGVLSQREPSLDVTWLTVRDVAERLQVTEETVRRWIRSAELPVIKLGDPRSGYRVHPADLESFLHQRYGRQGVS